MDQAIEETEPASEVNSIPLNIPIHPEEMVRAKAAATPKETAATIPESDNTGETLFVLDGGPQLEFAATPESDPSKPAEAFQFETETIPATTPNTKPRQRVVVNRPSPNDSADRFTTHAIDEFRTVRTTAYSHTEADHIKYGELSAMGKPLRFGLVRSAAADWSRYPVGTRFRIVGKPYEYVIDDYGSALVGTETIDLYKPSDDRMDNWGVREVEIEIIAWGSFGKSLEILEPREHLGDHIQQMISEIKTQPGTDTVADANDGASIQPRD